MSAQPSRLLFRIIVSADLITITTGVVVALLTEPTLPVPLRDWVQLEAETVNLTPRFVVLLCVGTLMVVSLLISTVGLLLFWRFARPLYFVTTLASVLLLPLSGPEVQSGWAAMFDDLGLLLSGVVLALTYWSPLRDPFENVMRTSTAQPSG